MNASLSQIVHEVMEVTGDDPPDLLRDDAPVLSDQAMHNGESDSDGFYLVGLIGGKDVGKSALVNAIAGQNITPSSSHGRGTEAAIAYVHTDHVLGVKALLEREAPGRYRIVTHSISDLRNQALLDLPDIDSHYQDHLQLTQTLLRHMLYPVWVSSIEKYADRQAQQMLLRVATGNAAGNFLFVLNKADQVRNESALQELRDDYAGRIARALKLTDPPLVYCVSATGAQAFELPKLKAVLGREKSAADVQRSKASAQQTQNRSLLAWLNRQDLPRRAESLGRLRQEVEETVAARVGTVLLDGAIPRLVDDPATQLAMADEVLTDRVARWPMVNLVHALLSPLFLLIRSATSRNAGPPLSADALVDASLRQPGEPLASILQSTFAQIRRAHPALAEFYGQRKLWEQMPAELALGELSSRLAETIRRQRQVARDRLSRGSWATAPLRWLLTIGAILWFPFLQPILEAYFRGQDVSDWQNVVGLIVAVLGVNYLLKSALFMVIWFLVLWLALRWNTQRRVGRLLSSWKATNHPDACVNLALQGLEWMGSLTDPIRHSSERVASLSQQVQKWDSTLLSKID